MTEETDWEQGAVATGVSADPTAMAIALGETTRAKADAFLDKPSRLTDLQVENLQKLD